MRHITLGIIFGVFLLMPIASIAQNSPVPSNQERPAGTNPSTEQPAGTNSTAERPAGTNLGESKVFESPIKSKTLIGLVGEIIKVIRIFAIPIVVLFIIYGGFLLATAGGRPDRLSSGKNTIVWALVGGVIVIGAEVILGVISSTISAI